MVRERSFEWDKVKLMWLESGGVMKLKDIVVVFFIFEFRVCKWKFMD